jgi:drug/metabolite transporter (DMT)-like permease
MGIVAVSFASILIRFAQGAGMPSLAVAAWRLIFASMILLPYAWATRRDEIRDLSGKEWALLVVSGLFLGLHFATWIASLGYTSVASSVVLVSMGPVFVGLGSWLVLREQPSALLVVGIILAVIGSVVISWGDLGQGRNQLLGDLLALAGAVFVAGYLMIGYRVRARRSLTTYIALVYGVAMVTLVIIVLIARQPMFGYSSNAYGWVLALALGPQIVGHSTLNWALRYLSHWQSRSALGSWPTFCWMRRSPGPRLSAEPWCWLASISPLGPSLVPRQPPKNRGRPPADCPIVPQKEPEVNRLQVLYGTLSNSRRSESLALFGAVR